MTLDDDMPPTELRSCVLPRRRGTDPDLESSAGCSLSDRTIVMTRLFKLNGGLATGDDLVGLLPTHQAQPLSAIARWIVCRRVISFQWQSQFFLPLFQFDLRAAVVRPDTTRVIEELKNTFDDWELASWFVEPSDWLQGAFPVEAITARPAEVVSAARADRFIARW
jgi:hypothetical protein